MIRTDLAAEALKGGALPSGTAQSKSSLDGIEIVKTEILTDEAARRVGKACGTYITAEVGSIANGLCDTENIFSSLAEIIKALLGDVESTLVIGVGNTDITPDALGPKTADGVLATRHLSKEFCKTAGLSGLKSVSVLSPGVLGRTGMEASEVIKSVCNSIKPQAVIAVDALAAADISRLGTTVQICNSGISPGSGVGNRRRELSERTLGVPVIAVGIPTVVDSGVLGGEAGYIVTPREIDLLISRGAELLSHAINLALQPAIDRDILLSLV